MYTVGNLLLWGHFSVIIIVMLTLDLLMQNRAEKKPQSMKKSAIWSLFWISIALLFNIFLWLYLLTTETKQIADDYALAFFTGYLIEKTLAVDNVFVWMVFFNYFSIPTSLQRRLLTWGIFGAIALRTAMVFTGSWLLNKFQWLFYVFGIFLLFTGIKMSIPISQDRNIENQKLMSWFYRHLRVTNELYNGYFFIRRDNLLFATPLLLALIMVEFSDVVFSLDSIPAIFAVSSDPFIVLTSNLFAILGLRAMYFLLANLAKHFLLLKYGLSFILIFIGTKMLIGDFIHIPLIFSLVIIAITLTITIVINILINQK